MSQCELRSPRPHRRCGAGSTSHWTNDKAVIEALKKHILELEEEIEDTWSELAMTEGLLDTYQEYLLENGLTDLNNKITEHWKTVHQPRVEAIIQAFQEQHSSRIEGK